MIEDGDRIVLKEGIGERVSKIRKRDGMATPEQEKAIAGAVFGKIDRKAAEPMTRAETGKGVNRARQLQAAELTLTPEERLMLESPHEILAIYTPEGRLKKAVLGDRSTVSIPEDVPSGGTLSHQHPSGRGPSDSDLKAALVRPGVTLRIVTVNENGKVEIFRLRATSVVDAEKSRQAARHYKDSCANGGDTPEARRAALVLMLERFPGMITVENRILP